MRVIVWALLLVSFSPGLRAATTVSPTAGPTLSPTPVPIQPYLAVGLVGTGTGVVTSSPPGINCHPNCTKLFAFNESVILTATPDPGSVFWKWTEASHPGCDDAMLMIDTTITCVASFLLIPTPGGPCAYNGDHPLNSCEACANWCSHPPNLRPQCACESVIDLCTGNGMGFPEFMDFAPMNSSVDSVRCGLNQPDSFCDCVEGQFSQYWSADPGPYVPSPTVAPPPSPITTEMVTGIPTTPPTSAPTSSPTSVVISSEETCQNTCDNMCGTGSNCTIYNQVAGLPTPPPTAAPTKTPTTAAPTPPPFGGIHPLNSCTDCFTWCLVSGTLEGDCVDSTCGATYQAPGVCFSQSTNEYCYCGNGNATFKGLDGVCDALTCTPINPSTMCTGLTECMQATNAPTVMTITAVPTVVTTTAMPTATTNPATLFPTAPANQPQFIWILIAALVTIVVFVALVACCCTIEWSQRDEDRRRRKRKKKKARDD